MRMLAVLLLALSLPAFAQKAKPGYTVTVHVAETRTGSDCHDVTNGSSLCKSTQDLVASIDGARYELRSETLLSKGLVALGDYPAKLVRDEQKPTHEFTRGYDLLFPDGSTRTFEVVGQVGQ